MTWVLIIGVLWPVLSALAAVVLGRSIRLAEQREVPSTTARGNFVVPPPLLRP